MSRMRPERAVVKKALQDADGVKSRAAALLGCTRQSLYTWIYQYGLDKFAGVRMDKRAELDRRERQHTRGREEKKSGVYSGDPPKPNLRLVDTAVSDLPIQATMKIRESVWRRMKIEAISRGKTVSSLAEEAFQQMLQDAEPKRRSRGRGDGDGQ